jgi:hypothetical protein
MRLKSNAWIVISVLLTVMTTAAVAQVSTTQIADTIYLRMEPLRRERCSSAGPGLPRAAAKL